jgi:GntP family gluconate:H+ symporter
MTQLRPAANSEVKYSMYHGMPLSQALVLLAEVIVVIVATQWRNFHPFLVIVVIATAFGFMAGFPTAQLASDFGSGFSEKIYSPGLVIVAAGLITGLAESTAASDRVMATFDRWRWLGSTRLAALLGLFAGIASSPTAAFALITPVVPAIGGKTVQSRQATSVTLALAISASHGLLVLTPVPIAAAAILGAQWDRVALFGLPLALLLVASGAVFARWLSTVGAAPQPPVQPPTQPQDPLTRKQSGGSAIVLLLAIVVPLLLLMVQSLGDMPSEPLGTGLAREWALGIGRPLVLFLVALGIMIVGHMRQGFSLLTDPVWTSSILGKVSGTLLVICAAGGLQRLCQVTGMAELLGERVLAWQVGPLGVLIPFLVAAVIKTLQGSSLVAAITTAGMVQPLLVALGLGDANGKALAALAIGAGAMTVSHINDEYFWLVTESAGLRPLRGFAAISLGTLLQGVIAVAALLLLSVLV